MPPETNTSPVPWLRANWFLLIAIFAMGGAFAESRLQISNLKDSARQQEKAKEAFTALQVQSARVDERTKAMKDDIGDIKKLLQKLTN